MESNQLKIINSWKLSYRNEILADIQHSLTGLKSESILKSRNTGLKWKVISRVIFSQVDDQNRFPVETEHFQRFTFKEPIIENLIKFQTDIAQKQSKGIYHYTIQPIGHTEKPVNNEILELTTQ